MGLLKMKERFSKDHIRIVKRMMESKREAKKKKKLIDFTNEVHDFYRERRMRRD